MQHKSEGKAKGKEVIAVRGVVAPSEWDMRDEVTAVTIYALDETEYVVNAKSMVKRLMKFMDEEVEAHGYMAQDEYGNEVFMVSEFAPVDVTEDGAEKGEGWDDEDEGIEEGEDWDDDEEDAEEGEDADGSGDWEGKDDDDGGGDGWKARRRR